MGYNLAAPENAELAKETECQKQASLWLYRYRRGNMTRPMIESELAKLAEPDATLTRKWLNHYQKLSRQSQGK
ncbi:hypothetical protein [Vibrio sp. H11]|uniref:hypothetical protein n=1 Tax=Vibrio sp. H11 TaxID=2565928 RepID=UPI0010A62153|nr:hypothetical protein [Vibrio sp. H11]